MPRLQGSLYALNNYRIRLLSICQGFIHYLVDTANTNKPTCSKGARTEPWGRPNGARAHGGRLVPNTTQLERPAKKNVIQSRGRPESPKETERLLIRIWWSTVSKAALMSNRASVTRPPSIAHSNGIAIGAAGFQRSDPYENPPLLWWRGNAIPTDISVASR